MMPPRSVSGRSFTPAVRERPGHRAAAAAMAAAGNASAASCWAWALPAPDMAAAGGGGGSSGRLSGGQVCPSRLGGPRTLLQVTVTMSEAGTTQAWSAELRHLACARHAGCCVAAARNAFAAPDGRLSLSYQHVIRLENFNTCVSGERTHSQRTRQLGWITHASRPSAPTHVYSKLWGHAASRQLVNHYRCSKATRRSFKQGLSRNFASVSNRIQLCLGFAAAAGRLGVAPSRKWRVRGWGRLLLPGWLGHHCKAEGGLDGVEMDGRGGV